MLSAGVKNPEIVDQLESHLHEDWARRVQSRESEDQAFEGAVQGVGQPSFGRIATRGGSRRDGDVAMAVFASYAIGHFMPLFY